MCIEVNVKIFTYNLLVNVNSYFVYSIQDGNAPQSAAAAAADTDGALRLRIAT